jgi:hypothetical protein
MPANLPEIVVRRSHVTPRPALRPGVYPPRHALSAFSRELDQLVRRCQRMWHAPRAIDELLFHLIDTSKVPTSHLRRQQLEQFESREWLGRLSLVFAHLDHRCKPEAWLLRVGMQQGCAAEGCGAPYWPDPRWPLNAPIADGTGHTVLHRALALGFLDFVEPLLWSGADPNRPDRKGQNLLHGVAGDARAVHLVKPLLWQGGRWDTADHQGRTPLHVAVDAENWPAVLELIKAGAPIDGLTLHLGALMACAAQLRDSVAAELLAPWVAARHASALTQVLPAVEPVRRTRRL